MWLLEIYSKGVLGVGSLCTNISKQVMESPFWPKIFIWWKHWFCMIIQSGRFCEKSQRSCLFPFQRGVTCVHRYPYMFRPSTWTLIFKHRVVQRNSETVRFYYLICTLACYLCLFRLTGNLKFIDIKRNVTEK